MKSLFVLSIVGLMSSASRGAVYSSNFDSAPYSFNANLNGLDGWTLTGASLPDVAIVRASPFPSPVSGSRAIHLGFQEIDPLSTFAYLYRSDGSGLVGNSLGYTEFQAAFIVQDSETPFVNRDGFSFTFRGSSNENLLTVSLEPTLQSVAPEGIIPPRVDRFSWTSGFAGGNTNIGTLGEGDWSTLNVLFTPSGANDVAFSVKFQNVEFASGILAGAASQNLGTYGLVWNPLDPDDVGSNVLIVDDVYLIPEPSSALLLGIAGLGLALRRRRA